MVALAGRQQQSGAGYLRRRYNESDPSLRVTKVVFVQSCRDSIPKNLIECLKEIFEITDPRTLQRKYTGDVFVVITRYDLVQNSENIHSTSNDEDELTLELFQKIEDELATAFGIHGTQKLSSVRWISMSDISSLDNAYIENIALKFLKRLVEPGTPRPKVKDPAPDLQKEILLVLVTLFNRCKKYLNILYVWAEPLVEEYVPMFVVKACLGVAIVLYMLYFMLRASH